MAIDVPTSLMRRIRLREVTESDLPIFFDQQCESDANRMAGFPARDRDAFMAHWAKILGDKSVLVRAIILDGQVAGNIVSWEREGKRLVGYWIGKNYWGRGIATAALSEYLTLVRLRPLYAHVAKHNLGSIRVLEKCGFRTCMEVAQPSDTPGDGVEELVFRFDAIGSGEVG